MCRVKKTQFHSFGFTRTGHSFSHTTKWRFNNLIVSSWAQRIELLQHSATTFTLADRQQKLCNSGFTLRSDRTAKHVNLVRGSYSTRVTQEGTESGLPPEEPRKSQPWLPLGFRGLVLQSQSWVTPDGLAIWHQGVDKRKVNNLSGSINNITKTTTSTNIINALLSEYHYRVEKRRVDM